MVTMTAAEDATLDDICHAFADPIRRSLWQQIGRSPGATTADLSEAHPSVTRWSVMKHLAVLRRAGLIQTLPEGRRRRHYRDARSVDPLNTWLAANA